MCCTKIMYSTTILYKRTIHNIMLYKISCVPFEIKKCAEESRNQMYCDIL